jgi:hypothetical protein
LDEQRWDAESDKYGYIYDAGSDGGSGMNRFSEVVLSGGKWQMITPP